MEEEIKIDWSRFSVSIPLKQTEAEIKKAWSSQQELEKWLLKKSEFTSEEGKKKKE
ncbi:hypothetical protein [Christiangramia sp. SM2212]|uniref:Uncharacterized protein n=1 Tax=Christiangramia sediminicola TaxID=3073267 RepID=A0ABU1EQS7_9FLAO|nr:hypothetical protein [Christiangramia sp. SM2212]MDR5590737.1 hypothetical protein [Christiangramia sp. SM2212]